MPYYTFFDEENVEWNAFMSISEMEQFLKDNPSVDVRPSAPAIGDAIRIGVNKFEGKKSQQWRDTFRNMRDRLGGKNFVGNQVNEICDNGRGH